MWKKRKKWIEVRNGNEQCHKQYEFFDKNLGFYTRTKREHPLT